MYFHIYHQVQSATAISVLKINLVHLDFLLVLVTGNVVLLVNFSVQLKC